MAPARPPIPIELVETVKAVKLIQLRKMRQADPWAKTARHEGWAKDTAGKRYWRSQLPPPDDENWTTWLIMAGRGWGKTRTGAEWIVAEVMAGRRRHLYLAGPTVDAVRDVMVEGPSGVIAVAARYGFGARYDVSRRRVVFANGAIARMYTAEKPRQARGPEFDGGWADEPASWKMPKPVRGEAQPSLWDNLQYGLRRRGPVGHQPRQVVTGTPAPVGLIRKILSLGALVVTRGTTYENRANLAETFYQQVITDYEGTRLGRQELEGELLEDIVGALWTYADIEDGRLKVGSPEDLAELIGRMKRMVLGIDPATTYGEESDLTSMTVAGIDAAMEPYVFDHWGGRATPEEWGRKAVNLYDHWELNEIYAESNQGGEMVRSTILNAARAMKQRTKPAPKVKLVHVNRGKQVRAESVSSLYEQHRAHHVGSFPLLEDQMVRFPVDEAAGDDHVDGLVHAIAPLIAKPEQLAVGIRRGSRA